MLDVFFTVDVEVWCDGWDDLDGRFPRCFREYVYGPTPQGDYGLPFQIELLRRHGLTGVFFVEPLFSTRFGAGPLEEIVGMLLAGDQEVQLHLHPEWVDEARQPLLPDVRTKRQRMFDYSLAEQTALIAAGLGLLRAAGTDAVNAFRAGGFGFNRDTLRALAANSVGFDSSYNASMYGAGSGVLPGRPVVEPLVCDNVIEYPMTVFDDGFGRMRHAQVTACSQRELEAMLWQALDDGRQSFVLLFHNFELLGPRRDRLDRVVLRRFEWLLGFLDRHRDCFAVRGFRGLEGRPVAAQPPLLQSKRWRTLGRMAEQLYRKSSGR